MTSRIRTPLIGVLCVLAMLVAACGGADSADFASEEVTLLIPRSAGGGYDTYARAFAEVLEDHLPEGTTIVPENVTGAAGRIAAAELAGADPDGHTLLVTDPEGLLAYQMVGDTSYDLDAFETFGTLAVRPSAFVVGSGSSHVTFEDLRSALESEQLVFATTGVGSPTFLDAVFALDAIGATTPTIVPHEGSAEAITSLVRGDSDFAVFAFDTLGDAAADGDVDVLLQFSETPLDDIIAGVPTGADAGLGDYDGILASSLVVYGPPEMPEDVATMLRDAVEAAVTSDAWQAFADETGRVITPQDAETTEERVQARRDLYESNMDVLEEYVEL